MTKFLLRDSSGPTCGGESSGGEKELEYEDSAKRLFERNEWIRNHLCRYRGAAMFVRVDTVMNE